MAQVTGAINAPFRAMRSAFTRRPEPSASEPPAPPPQLGCHVAEITSEEKDQFDGEEAQGLYRHAADIVQDVVLLGTPIGIEVLSPLSPSPDPASPNQQTLAWERARQVVAGRLINGYSERDYVLALLYRYEKWAVNVAGLKAIEVEGVENVNLSSTIAKVPLLPRLSLSVCLPSLPHSRCSTRTTA
jgi:hypothetical protein